MEGVLKRYTEKSFIQHERVLLRYSASRIPAKTMTIGRCVRGNFHFIRSPTNPL